MSNTTGRAWKRIAALALAGTLAVAGLWLAVGAGAKGGPSARDAAYPVTYHFKTKIDDVKFGKLASTHSNKARFKFHIKADPGYQSQLKYLAPACRIDHKKLAKCDSPKTYKHLKAGKHKFQVRAYYDKCGDPGTTCDASAPAKYRWKVK
jgi:hypothetical protein